MSTEDFIIELKTLEKSKTAVRTPVYRGFCSFTPV